MSVRFCRQVEKTTEAMKLVSMKKNGHESYLEYASRVYQQALTTHQGQVDETILIGIFLSGIEDPDIIRDIQKERPSDIWEGATIAERFKPNQEKNCCSIQTNSRDVEIREMKECLAEITATLKRQNVDSRRCYECGKVGHVGPLLPSQKILQWSFSIECLKGLQKEFLSNHS
ncbi:hypothetical protein RF11_04415 [Thelohanellus kitauei]|uniref:CCHC-type domain-containing protein n=1 Tax=Thelohanellus kitauei TaxID=669202 RepID=A0A0C2MGR2_THEKT|nr:hypothetical protein RF11_04415 [Thelohanellus kitauei]